MKQETKELSNLITEYQQGSVVYELKPFDSNHWLQRVFRLYIDGSHSYPNNEPGYKFYERTKKRINEILSTGTKESQYKKLVSMAIDMFVSMLSAEFTGISRSTIQKTIVNSFSKSDLDLLNQKLVDDLQDLVAE